MRDATALVLALALAACGEKMTPDRCASVMTRVSACMDPSVKVPPADVAPDHEMFDDLCQVDEMMRVAGEADVCLHTTHTCAELQACFKQPDLRIH